MDWHHQLLDSVIWLCKAFAISMVAIACITALIGKFTDWGQQFLRVTWAWFSPVRSWRPLAILSLLILMTLFSVRMEILFTFWSNGMYTSLQDFNAAAFWSLMAVFGVLASVHVLRALVNFYISQAFQIHWRVWLTENLMARWLDRQAYYRSQHLPNRTDNPDQRIQQDIAGFVSSSLTLFLGLISSVVSLFSFTLILWRLSGTLTLFGEEIPRAMIFLVYAYVLVATVFAVKLGRPLIKLNFLNEKLNADFRYALIRLREYGENIAFFRGEAVEHRTLLKRFSHVIENAWAIVFRSLKFQGFNLGINQLAVVFPMVVQAPRFFSKQITLGDLTQTAQAFGQVQDALSFFRSSYDEFAGYRAIVNRLTGFLDTVDAADQLTMPQIVHRGQNFAVEALTVKSPGGAILTANLNLALAPGAALLVRGPSGVGKTTLLRAIAGLWPYAGGEIVYPAGQQCLFLPQKPYLPLGTLRSALYYPLAEPVQPDDSAARAILEQIQLGHLAAELDTESEWSNILSLGEQQRLALGRVLLHRPQLVFLDEASSAMDEGLEHAMYSLLRKQLPDVMLISVGHRSSLAAFHGSELILQHNGKWRLNSLE
ncbi:ABC transporter ATP-binding protein/permease [Collimonas antrihumi]|uniref:ABC transporter ATP-binding protein/permease n=1 Tax=Collimonas antrihumi TaxID=1940615 RepID=UPI001B8D9716|nr:ABC transporter ATP-binding protein/permease [Collimonas antrihumi]